MATVIKVENLSKKFIIAHEGREKYTALRDVMANQVKKTFQKTKEAKPTKEDFWALKDVSFDIQQGDRVGIIGRNGAGKSTLLKILSRITEPSSGTLKIKGRVASLLEVGTGFHPELTGRENIFLNGAILGMSRSEIRKHFDAIVDFAEIEKFLDTPVKRYSSGMYVRLAFAVAAHLEPEILIVDEVLAVGDAQFQKKCLGKMEDVSKEEGKTVLFVSHNMGLITQLCQSAILLDKGVVAFIGDTNSTINKYININTDGNSYKCLNKNKAFYFETVEVLDETGIHANTFVTSGTIGLKISIAKKEISPVAKLSCTIQNRNGDYLTTFVENLDKWFDSAPGLKEFKIEFPGNLLTPNFYAFRLGIFLSTGQVYDLIEMVCPINIIDGGTSMAAFEGINYGYFFTKYEFKEI